jgi:predicted nucleotidyltransferase
MVFKGKCCYIRSMKINDPILASFRRGLDEIYGNRLERVVLFGSRARGEAEPDSDYDVALFLKDMPDRWVEFDRLIGLRVNFLDNYDADFTVLPFKGSDYDKETGLMEAIRTEGIPL